MLVTSGSLRTGPKSELKFGLKLKPGILAGAATLVCLLVLAQVGAAGKGLDTLRAGIGLLAAVGHLVEEQVGVLAEAVTTLAASIRLLVHVSVLMLRQI